MGLIGKGTMGTYCLYIAILILSLPSYLTADQSLIHLLPEGYQSFQWEKYSDPEGRLELSHPDFLTTGFIKDTLHRKRDVIYLNGESLITTNFCAQSLGERNNNKPLNKEYYNYSANIFFMNSHIEKAIEPWRTGKRKLGINWFMWIIKGARQDVALIYILSKSAQPRPF